MLLAIAIGLILAVIAAVALAYYLAAKYPPKEPAVFSHVPPQRIVLPDDDFDALVERIEEPPQPTKALRELSTRRSSAPTPEPERKSDEDDLVTALLNPLSPFNTFSREEPEPTSVHSTPSSHHSHVDTSPSHSHSSSSSYDSGSSHSAHSASDTSYTSHDHGSSFSSDGSGGGGHHW